MTWSAIVAAGVRHVISKNVACQLSSVKVVHSLNHNIPSSKICCTVLSVTQNKLLVNVSYTKGDVLHQGYRISLKMICGIWSLDKTTKFQSSKNYPPLIHTHKGRHNSSSANYTARLQTFIQSRRYYWGGQGPPRAVAPSGGGGDIIRISRWNVSTVARSHGSEYHDGKETISIDEVLLEELILAKIINEFPAFYKTETFSIAHYNSLL